MVSHRLLAGLVLGCLLADSTPGGEESATPKWRLVWNDEFSQRQIDAANWSFDTGNGFYDPNSKQWVSGWGNDELQYYTSRPENAFIKDGELHIRALMESYEKCGYTSARLKTCKNDKTPLLARTYGRFEFRAKLPIGQGLWPAIWLLPLESRYGGWAASGEIDVMEAKGQEPNRISGALHFGSRWPKNAYTSKEYTLPANRTIDGFHVYALEWYPGEICWYVDDHLYMSQTFWWSSSLSDRGRGIDPSNESELNRWPAPFDEAFYLVMNLAIGGKFPGNPDNSTQFPAEMVIDYVRVYEMVGGWPPLKPRGPGALPYKP